MVEVNKTVNNTTGENHAATVAVTVTAAAALKM